MRYLISICICLLLVAPCMAETINVDANGSVDFNNIQAAINAAFDGDTVLVADGTYTGPGNRDIDFLGKAITVRSESGPENCIIDCNGTEADPHRGFYFHNGEDANSVIDGFTITNGYIYDGGGVYCNRSNPTIINCMFIGNWAKYCGGMLNVDSSPTVTNCTFSGNSARYEGGGMYNHGRSNPTVTNCTFSGNSARYSGGGMENDGRGSPTITNCTFSGNSADRWGGGMYNEDSSLILTNCTFSGNSARYEGGGMYNFHSSPTLTNSTFSGNWAGSSGGGMENRVSSPTLTNCAFSGNSACESGGGIYNEFSDPNLTNCIFSGNWAGSSGGGMANYHYYDESSTILTNCILWGNTALYGKEIALCDWSTIDVNYCDVQGGQAAIYNDGTCTLNWGNNIDADPRFVELGYWDTNGTPYDVNDDFWVEGDYHLLPDSPCIDSGDNNSVPADIHDLDGDGNTAEPLPFDLDGNPRFVDRPDIEDTGNGTPPIVDMGAYEAMVSCFGVNHIKLGTKAGKKGNKVEVKGTFDPASPIDFAVDDVTYTIDDGLDYMLTFIIPAGSFEPEGKPDKQKFRFHSPKGSQPGIKAKFDFLKCKFELKVKGVMDTSEITAETLAIVLQAGANIAQEIVELEVKGKKGEHLEYKRKPKFECCPEM